MKKLLFTIVIFSGIAGEALSMEGPPSSMVNDKSPLLVRDFITYDEFHYEYPEQLQKNLMVEGDTCDLTQVDKNNESLFDILAKAKDFNVTVLLKIDNAIIPNTIFDSMDQMHYLELNSPIIYADDDTFDCLFEKLKINKTLKSLILRNPRLYTGLGTYNVSRYYDGLNILYQKNAVLGLIEALKNNNTLVNLSLFGGLFYDDIQVLKNGLVNHPSLKKVTLEEEDFNVEGKALITGCKCCCVLL